MNKEDDYYATGLLRSHGLHQVLVIVASTANGSTKD